MRKQDRLVVCDNQQIYTYYFERLVNIALSQFSYKNLPDTCDRWYFEQGLLFNGTAAMYRPKHAPDMLLSTGYTTRDFNIYNKPAGIAGYGFNATNIETDDFVVCYDNMTRNPLIMYIRQYAYLLWEIHMTFRANLNMQRTPYIIKATKNTALSVKNIFNQIFGFKEAIYIKDTQDIRDAIDALKLDVPFNGQALLACLRETWDAALAMLGVTGEMQKHERMNNTEVLLNSQEDGLSLNSRYLNRYEFVQECNKKWGLDMEVVCNQFSSDFMPYPDESYNYKGGDE